MQAQMLFFGVILFDLLAICVAVDDTTSASVSQPGFLNELEHILVDASGYNDAGTLTSVKFFVCGHTNIKTERRVQTRSHSLQPLQPGTPDLWQTERRAVDEVGTHDILP